MAIPSPTAAMPAVVLTPETTASPARPIEPDIAAGPLQVSSGSAVAPGQTVFTKQVQLDSSDFMIGLRPDLAPKHVDRLIDLIAKDAYGGRPVDATNSEFVVLSADMAKAGGEALATIKGESNRVVAAKGLLYFDGTSRLGFALGAMAPKAPWVCVGQIQLPGAVVAGWREGKTDYKTVRYLGDMRS